MMFWYGNDMSGWGYVLMTVGMVLFWGLVIFGIVALVRSLGRTSQQTMAPLPHRSTPEQVLADRFAHSDIDEQEYKRRLDTLHHHTQPSSGSDELG